MIWVMNSIPWVRGASGNVYVNAQEYPGWQKERQREETQNLQNLQNCNTELTELTEPTERTELTLSIGIIISTKAWWCSACGMEPFIVHFFPMLSRWKGEPCVWILQQQTHALLVESDFEGFPFYGKLPLFVLFPSGSSTCFFEFSECWPVSLFFVLVEDSQLAEISTFSQEFIVNWIAKNTVHSVQSHILPLKKWSRD